MSLIPRRDNRISASRAALSAAGITSIANLLRQGYNYLDQHGQPFPTHADMQANSKRYSRGHANSNGYKRGRVARSYVPRGRFLNYRTGGFEGKELKFYDTNAPFVKFPLNAYFSIPIAAGVSTPDQGTGASQRIGRRFSIKSVNLQAKINLGTSLDSLQPIKTGIFKIFLVQDRQCNKAALTDASQVFSGGNIAAPMLELENSDRFRILKSKTVVIEPNNTAPQLISAGASYTNWSGAAERAVNVFWKGHINVLCEPGNTGAGATATMDNMVYVILWTNSTTTDILNSNQPSFNVVARTRYCC